MESLHESDEELLTDLSKRAISDGDIQLLLQVIAEMNAALNEKRDVNPSYLPMLKILLAVHGTVEVDLIRFGASIKPRSQG